jgi:hypothetical protein
MRMAITEKLRAIAKDTVQMAIHIAGLPIGQGKGERAYKEFVSGNDEIQKLRVNAKPLNGAPR